MFLYDRDLRHERVKPLFKKIQTEPCLGNPEITGGGDVESEDDFLFDSTKMQAPCKAFKRISKN